MAAVDGSQRKAVVASLFRLYSSGHYATANRTLLEEDGLWESSRAPWAGSAASKSTTDTWPR